MTNNWPTVDAINSRIALSYSSNNKKNILLKDKGNTFIKFGKKYGINPGFIVAIMQKESQLGADGSFLTHYFNFAGITDPYGIRSTCPPVTYKNRQWACFASIDDAVEGVFKVINQPNYRGTDGTVRGITNLYSPSFENNTNEMLKITEIVGRQMNISLKPETQIYGGKSVVARIVDRIKK